MGPAEDVAQLRRFYRVLDVPPEAPAHAIKVAYRRLAKAWHPDAFPPGSGEQARAGERMRAINEAYARIRHAPLRYHVSTHPRIMARRERRAASGPPPPPAREWAPIDASVETVVRFAFGAVLGLVAVLVARRAGVRLGGPAGLAVVLLCAGIATLRGDRLWRLLLALLFWW